MTCISDNINFDEDYYVVNGLNGIPTIRQGKFSLYPNKSYAKFTANDKEYSDSYDHLNTFDDMQIDCIFSGDYDEYGRRIFKLTERDKANDYLKHSCQEQIKGYEAENKENQIAIAANNGIIIKLAIAEGMV